MPDRPVELATSPTGPKPPRGLIIVPAYNEAAVIETSLKVIAIYLGETLPAYTWEIMVVDDGSSDGTAEIVRRTSPGLPVSVRLVEREVNGGLGNALLTAFTHADADIVVTMDADLSYDIGHIERLVRAWESSKAAIVVASPYAEGGAVVAVPTGLRLRSQAANKYLGIASGRNLATFTGMVRAYDGRFLRNTPIGSEGIVINVELIRKAYILGLKVIEIPATLNWSDLQSRRSRAGLVTSRSLRETRRLLREGFLFRPRLYSLIPGIIGLVVAGIALGFGGMSVALWAAAVACVLLILGFLAGIGYHRDFRQFRKDFDTAEREGLWPQQDVGWLTQRRRGGARIQRRGAATISTSDPATTGDVVPPSPEAH